MKALNGNVYGNCYERAGAYYETTCAPSETDSGRVAVREFMLTIYRVFSEKCAEMGLHAEPDVWLEDWEQQKGREKDIKLIRSSNAKVMEFVEMLLTFMEFATLVETGLFVDKKQLKLKKFFFQVLDVAGITYSKGEQIGIIMDRKCALAFLELAKHAISLATNAEGEVKHDLAAFYFSRVVFNEKEDWLVEGFDEILGAEGCLVDFCRTLEEQGFYREIRIDGRDFSLNYLKDFGKKPEPLKKAFGERTRLGIEISYEDTKINPGVLSLRLPFYSEVLTYANQLSREVKEFALNHTKTCDGCRYCVQMDKTGKKPLAAITVENIKKCPYYPSFSYRFTEMNKNLAGELLKLFDEVTALYERCGKRVRENV